MARLPCGRAAAIGAQILRQQHFTSNVPSHPAPPPPSIPPAVVELNVQYAFYNAWLMSVRTEFERYSMDPRACDTRIVGLLNWGARCIGPKTPPHIVRSLRLVRHLLMQNVAARRRRKAILARHAAYRQRRQLLRL